MIDYNNNSRLQDEAQTRVGLKWVLFSVHYMGSRVPFNDKNRYTNGLKIGPNSISVPSSSSNPFSIGQKWNVAPELGVKILYSSWRLCWGQRFSALVDDKDSLL